MVEKKDDKKKGTKKIQFTMNPNEFEKVEQ